MKLENVNIELNAARMELVIEKTTGDRYTRRTRNVQVVKLGDETATDALARAFNLMEAHHG
jgi:hypothetical protein